MPNTYSPPSLTPAGQQLATSQEMFKSTAGLTPAQATSQIIPQQSLAEIPMSINDPAALASAAESALTTKLAIDDPRQRELYLREAEIPESLTNYEDVARQLYNYDVLNLQPKYQMPGVAPVGAVSEGRVEASTLPQLTPETAGDFSAFLASPQTGIAIQTAQKENIADLLSSLGASMEKEVKRATGKYALTAKAQTDVMNYISDLIKTGTEAQTSNDQKLRDALAKADELALKRKTGMATKAQTLANKAIIEKKYLGDPGTFFSGKKDMMSAVAEEFPEFSNEDISDAMAMDPSFEGIKYSSLKGDQQRGIDTVRIILATLDAVEKSNLINTVPTGAFRAMGEEVGRRGLLSDVLRTPGMTDLIAIIGPLRDIQYKDLSGVGVSGREQERLIQGIISPGYLQDVNLANLGETRNRMLRAYKETMGVDVRYNDAAQNLRDQGFSEDQIIQWAKKKGYF